MIKANFNTYNNYVTDSLYQWDVNQDLVINGLNLTVAPEIHFANADMDRAIVRQSTLESGVVTVRIPNSLLQAALTIKAYVGIYEGETFKVIETIEIPVIAKTKPADYTIEDSDEEFYSFNKLENEIANAKKEIADQCEANRIEMVATVEKATEDLALDIENASAAFGYAVEESTQLLEARLDMLASLPEGSTTGDAELMDIRVGYNGDYHTSAGKAVRKQFKQVNNALDKLGRNVTTGKNKLNPDDPDYMAGHRASSTNGTPSSNASTDLTGYIAVKPGMCLISSGIVSGTTRQGNMAARYYGYDINTVFVANSYKSIDGTSAVKYYTVPDGVYFVRAAIDATATKRQIEEGTRFTLYEPYTDDVIVFNIPLDELGIDIPTKTSDLENDSGFIGKVVKPLALPSKLYAFANQPVSVFLRNIIDYNENDVYVRMVTSNKGKLYAKRWEYTPQAAETVSIKFHIEDHNYNVLNDDTFSLVVKNSTTKESLTVLVIGDSTVNAGTETQKMLDLATADGYGLTLLGTRGSVGSLNQHEGRGGWTADMYVNDASNSSGSVINAFYNPNSSQFDFSYYMTQQGYNGVDCVFIQLGINDVFSVKTDSELATAIETYLNNLETMIASIHNYDSNIKVVLNTVIPCTTDQDAFADTYGMVQTVWRCKKNTYDTNIALIERFKNATNVYISPFNASLDTVNNMDGGVHPVTNGYNQLGTQMYSFMRAIN